MSRIIKQNHPESSAIVQSWQDQANITGQQYVKRPYWYKNTEIDQTYYDLFGCIGWPSEVNDKDDGTPGYVAIVGVVKSKDETKEPIDAAFRIMAEAESKDISTLLDHILRLREEYGYGQTPKLLSTFYGDPERFITTMALFNEKLEDSKTSVLVSPPADFYLIDCFDVYVRSLRSVLMSGKTRLYFGKDNELLKNRIREFHRGDPMIFAMGGLIHTLLNGCEWMDQSQNNMFIVEEGEAQ